VVDTAASPTANLAEYRENGTARIAFGYRGTLTITATAINSITFPSLEVRFSGSQRIVMGTDAGGSYIALAEADYGDGLGTNIGLKRNSNTSSKPGFVALQSADAQNNYIWSDNSDLLRIWTSAPNGEAPVGSIVVGTQTSQLATKELLPGDLTPGEALRAMLDTTIAHFRYKNGAYNNSEFHGIVADWSPEFAMDAGRVFNPISAHGYTVQAVKALWERIQQLEQTIAEWSAD